jgi:hypothetical protein
MSFNWVSCFEKLVASRNWISKQKRYFIVLTLIMTVYLVSYRSGSSFSFHDRPLRTSKLKPGAAAVPKTFTIFGGENTPPNHSSDQPWIFQTNYSTTPNGLKLDIGLLKSKLLHVNIKNNNSNYPHYCFLVRSYVKQKTMLWSLLGGLHRAQYPNMTVFLLNTDSNRSPWPEFSQLDIIAEKVFGRKFVTILPFDDEEALGYFPLLQKTDYGYIQSDLSLQWIMANSSCEYLTVTNGDNWYPPQLFPELERFMRAGKDLIGFHFISHYHWPRTIPHVVRSGPDTEMMTKFKVNHIGT